MDGRRVLVVLLMLASARHAMAQAPDLVPTAKKPSHQITTRQIEQIRQIESQRQDQSSTQFSMPGSARGKSIKTAPQMHRLLDRMSRRDRNIFFGQSKADLSERELTTLATEQDLVVYELDVTETDPTKPVIDVDGDGTLDRVDAIRYSGPDFPNLRLCGPTMVMRRNQKLIVNLKNRLKADREPVLEWNPDCEPPSPPDPPAYWMMDAPHDLFSTNLHTHGLHVCPGGRHDNVFLDVPPTTSDTPNELFLDYELPSNHVAGTFWYHAHRHGSVAYQLANGMAGALIVLGDPDPNSNDLESLPEIRAANLIKHPTDNTKDVEYGRVLLLQQLVFTQVPDGAGGVRWIVDPADINDRKSAPNEKNTGRIAEGIPENKPDAAEVLAVNGQNSPSIEIQRGQIERWRLIHAGRESALNLAWYRAQDLQDSSIEAPEITPAIESYEIATDGIPTGYLKKVTSTDLYPGYRSDILVRVTDQAADGEYWLLPCEAQRLTKTHLGPIKNSTPAIKLVVRGRLPVAMQLPQPAMLRRLRRQPPDLTNVERLDLRFTFADKERFGVANVAHGTGKPYAESGIGETIGLTLNATQVWNLGVREFLPGVPEAVKHPFHMHVNPFYVPSLGVWKDTIVIDRESDLEIQFLPTDYAGRSVIHCHILDHEDQGMMKDINIIGTRRADYPELYSFERIPEDSQIKIDGLSLVPGKNTVVVFVTGLGCEHCSKGLVKLWKRSDPLKNLNAAIRCMSSTPFQQKDLNQLGLAKKDHFTFHGTPTAFDLAQCDTSSGPTAPASQNQQGVTHGVLIFDQDQHLRFRYLADHPLTDLDEITYALMELQEEIHSPKGKFHRVSTKHSGEPQ